MNPTSAAEGAKPAPPEFQQQENRQFKSKAPKPGQKSFDSSLQGTDGYEDSAVVCPWEEFTEADLREMARFGII